MIYLCFDLGLKNTGVAWADSTKLPQPLTTLYHRDTKHLLDQIKKTIAKHNPDLVIFGKPSKGIIEELSKDLKTGGEIEEMRIKAKKVLDRILEILKEENFLLDISAAMIQIGPDIYKAVSVVKLIPK